MLSDEEKKAIDNMKSLLLYSKEHEYFSPFQEQEIDDMNIVLNLIEKQSKEIEDLKETLKCTQNSWFEDTQKIEEMKKQIDLDNECEIALNSKVMDLEKEIEELKNADLTTVYLNGVYDGEKKVKDKIKAKIEELEKLDFGTDLVSQFTANLTTITILRSLLEKE